MNIAVFIKRTTFHKGFGGLEVQNKILCEGFVKRGHSVTVFAPKWQLGLTEIEDAKIKYVFVEGVFKNLFEKINGNSWYNKSLQKFKEIHTHKKFDIVISQSSAGISIIDSKNSLDVKVISIAHGTTVGELDTLFLTTKNFITLIRNAQYVLRQYFGNQRRYILHSNRVVAVSSFVKSKLIDETFAPDNLIEVIHNGIEVFDKAKSSPENASTRLKLFYIGQVTLDKGADTFLKLSHEESLQDCEFNVIGDGTYLDAVKSNKKINVFGKLPHSKILTILSEVTNALFVFPTKRVEGFPMVLVESLFAGMPVVAYDRGGVKDSVINNVTGYLFAQGDYVGLKNKIAALALDSATLQRISVSARDYALQNFTSDIMVEKYEKIIMEVLKR